MDSTLAVLADYANISQEKKLNIMGIFQEVNPPILPFALPQAFLVVVFSVSPAEAGTDKRTRIVFMDSDGKEVVSIEQDLKIPQAAHPGERIGVSLILGFSGVRFEKAGDYSFSVLVGGEEKASVSLRVNEVRKGA